MVNTTNHEYLRSIIASAANLMKFTEEQLQPYYFKLAQIDGELGDIDMELDGPEYKDN